MNLICPKDGSKLAHEAGFLACEHNHRFPVIDGVPVLLRDDKVQTIGVAAESLKADDPPLYLRSVGISDEERDVARGLGPGPVDPVVSVLVGATSGISYKHLIGRLRDYPIPEIPIPVGSGLLLDVGCNWGRWSIAAARKGYCVVGIDPSLGAVLAAKRAATRLGVDAQFICADARFLPFESETFDGVYSYSVLQHLSREDVSIVVLEISRVLKPSGYSLVQMAHKIGLRSLYHQLRRFREAKGFEVRYWSLGQLRRVFSAIGPTEISAHCFGGLGLEHSDAASYRTGAQLLVATSDCIVAASRVMRPLVRLADSVFVRSVKT